jgi:hypothetical protein
MGHMERLSKTAATRISAKMAANLGIRAENLAGRTLSVRAARARPHTQSCGWSLLGLLPILQRLWPCLNPFQIGVDAVSPRRRAGLLRGCFLPPGLLLSATFLALALALALLL